MTSSSMSVFHSTNQFSLLVPSPLSCPTQAGSAHVRIRRDANEQLVLAHVTTRLLPLVSPLTVQIFKDEWSRPLLAGTLTSSSAPPPSHLPPPPLGVEPLTSTPTRPSGPPPEFSFNSPGRNLQPLVLPAVPGPAHRPFGGLGLAAPPPYLLGVGGASHSYRTTLGTGGAGPLRFGTSIPPNSESQHRHYRP